MGSRPLWSVSRIFTALVTLVLLTPGAVAQLPSGNLFFGYSYLHATVPAPALLPDRGGVEASGSTGLNGWNASVEMKFLPLIGLVADFSGHYGSVTVTDQCGNIAGCVPLQDSMNAHVYNFLVGPEVSFTIGRVRPFAHAMFGAGHVSESTKTRPFSSTDTAFAYAVGGGLDYKLFGPVRWRAQADFLQDQFFSTNRSNFRFSTGPVLHF